MLLLQYEFLPLIKLINSSRAQIVSKLDLIYFGGFNAGKSIDDT